MRLSITRVGFAAAASALIGAAACGSNAKPIDDGLQKDLAAAGANGLELSPNSASARLVISADEAGPTASPRHASPKLVPRPTPRPAPRLAANLALPVQSPAPRPHSREQAPSLPAVTAEPAPARQVEPPPLPPANRANQERQKGTYKTEGEIFRQMPWIKP